MQEYTLGVDFKNKQIYGPTIELVQNDHNSTKLNFNFAETYDNFIKTIEIKYPSGKKLIDEIKDNTFIIKDILVESGEYQYEVVIYDETSKLTNFAIGNLFVREQLVKDSDEEIQLETEYPILNQLIIDTKTALTQEDNLNVNAEKVDGVTTIEITKKDGDTESVEINDGEKGEKGFSPTANVEQTEYGVAINITDENGTTKAELYNGENGQDGYTPIKGADYFTDDEKNQFKEEVISIVNPTIEEIKEISEHAETIARGRATGYVFDTLEDLEIWLEDETNVSNLILGDNFYIRALNTPDYWWDGSDKQQLEAEKPDLTNLVDKSSFVYDEETETLSITI